MKNNIKKAEQIKYPISLEERGKRRISFKRTTRPDRNTMIDGEKVRYIVLVKNLATKILKHGFH